MFNDVYKGKKVFLTGHTGFKGSWLAFWLHCMGAKVKGYALKPDTEPSHWNLLGLDIESVYADIRDTDLLTKEIQAFKPDVVFHLAAQPIVRLSYELPLETYEVNVLGTLKLFEACRKTDSVRAIVNVTTDKCYENKEWHWGYRENDRLGGYDPYSSSKACSEILTSSYRQSFFNPDNYGKEHKVLIASARAGNVVGGGDWALDRLVPDIMKATADKQRTNIRNPFATRPWQHVLEPLSGYLLLGMKLLNGNKNAATSWNFGPDDASNLTVETVCSLLKDNWDEVSVDFGQPDKSKHEAKLLKLDCSKANAALNWYPVWDHKACFEKTANWYANFYRNGSINTPADLEEYISSARQKQTHWAL